MSYYDMVIHNYFLFGGIRETPLMVASRHPHRDVVKHLVTAGANINAKDKNNATALHYAAEVGFVSAVELLLHKAASIDIKAKNGLVTI